MATVVYGTEDEFAMRTYSIPPPSIHAMMDQSYDNFQARLTGVAQQMFQTGQELYQKINYSDTMRMVRAATRGIEQVFIQNQIQELQGIAALQHAPPIMVEYVMANPMVQQMYSDKMLDGYPGQYVNHQPNVYFEFNEHYRKATHGLIQIDEEGNEYANGYMELMDANDNLTIHEQIDVQQTWRNIETYLQVGLEDPTSPQNKLL